MTVEPIASGDEALIDSVLEDEDLQSSVMCVVGFLAEFVRSHNKAALCAARKKIGHISTFQSEAVGEALWDIAIKLQREILPVSTGEEGAEGWEADD